MSELGGGVPWGEEGGRRWGEGGSFLRFTQTIPILVKDTFHLQSTFRTDTLLMQTAAASISIMFYWGAQWSENLQAFSDFLTM